MKSQNSKQNNKIVAKNSSSQQNQQNIVLQSKSLLAKKLIREQGKKHLLNGCYLMASNKYLQLIQMGIQQFSTREQAIIYLNCGICYQFLDQNKKLNFMQALTFMKKALQTDKTYEKTYYRMMQLLRDHQYYQTALTIIPPFVHNQQIGKLLQQIKQLYIKQSSISKMIESLQTKQITLVKFQTAIQKLTKNIYESVQQSQKNSKFSQQFIRKAKILLFDINSLYKIAANQKKNIPQELKDKIMQQFCKFIQKLYSYKLSRPTEQSKNHFMDFLLQSFLMQYRGNLVQFIKTINYSQKYNTLKSNSMFLNNNQYVRTTSRKSMTKYEIGLLRFIRIIDTNVQLFCQVYTFLSDCMFDKIKKQILINSKQNQTNNQNQFQIDNKFIHKFLASNYLNSLEITFQAKNSKDKNTNKVSQNYGRKCQYLFQSISIDQLNLLKKFMQDQCSKINQIYSLPQIKQIWLEHLHEFLYQVDSVVAIFMTMLQIYYTSKMPLIKVIQHQIIDVQNICHLISIRHWQKDNYRRIIQRQLKNNNKQTIQQQNIKFGIPEYASSYNFQSFLKYFQKSTIKSDFISILLSKQIIQFIQYENVIKNDTNNQNSNKKVDKITYKQQILQICQNSLLDINKKIEKLKQQQTQNNNKKIKIVYNEIYLILVCITLKLDIKRNIKIDQKVIVKQIYQDILCQISLQCLLLLLLNKSIYVLYYIQNFQHVTKLIKHFLGKQLIEQIQPFGRLLSIIYFLICDFQQDQQKYFSKKLGVTQQQVHKARQIQKQISKQNQIQRAKINKEKQKIIKKVSQEWIQILNQLCKIVRVTLKMDQFCSIRLCKIIYTIAQVNHKKLYSNQVVEFMLESRKINQNSNNFQFNCKQAACKFFQIICKKCNIQLFQYKHLQGIVDSLLWLIKNCEHELIYFESLLGLVNLSTASVRIPVEQIEKCLYEQNSYIVHAGVCIMNNILIYGEQFIDNQEKSKKFKSRISDIVFKYVQFYRDQIQTIQSQLPQTDYSHPKKIYNSLISLATVLKLDKLEQLQSWEKGKNYVKKLTTTQSIDYLFKLVIYFSLQGKLPRGWNNQFECELKLMQRIEPQKYSKIVQLI